MQREIEIGTHSPRKGGEKSGQRALATPVILRRSSEPSDVGERVVIEDPLRIHWGFIEAIESVERTR